MLQIDALYLHFPFCKHLCNYCDFFKHVLDDVAQVTQFESLLANQWQVHKEFLTEKQYELGKLDSIYLGGGTPSLWGESGAGFIKDLIDSKEIEISKDCEFTLEVDPDAWDENSLAKWFETGVNRVSVGAQAFDKKFLEILDRQHSQQDIVNLLKYLQTAQINYSVDLLIGTPQASERNVLAELEKFISYGPSHFSVYILKTRKNYPHKHKLPSDEHTANEYLSVCEFLANCGYEQYEVSNFSLPQRESRHNKKYWAYKSVAAIGPVASGLLVGDKQSLRYQWKGSSAEFQEELISGTSLIIEQLFLRFRTKVGICLDEIFSSPDQQAVIDKLYLQWQKRGYLAAHSTREQICLSPQGYLLSDSILDDLFREIEF